MMKIKQRITERRQAIKQFEHNKPLVRASNCMGGRISAAWGVHTSEPTWLKTAKEKLVSFR
jgi:hypothetical protein